MVEGKERIVRCEVNVAQMLLACYTEFEERVGIMDDTGVKSSAYDVVKIYARNYE